MKHLLKHTSKITDEIALFVDALQREKPEKEFSFLVSETKMLWFVNWKSTEYLKEYFQVEIWKENEKYSLMGEHFTEDVLEHWNEEYFFYEEKTEKELLIITNEIIQEFKEGVLEATNV